MKIRIVKIILTIILTFSGVIGLLFKFKNEEGTLTYSGYVGLILIIIAGLIHIILEVLENSKDKKEKHLAEIARKDNLLRDLHSPVNEVANKAVHELRALGKLTGEKSWVRFAKLGGKADLSKARLYDTNFEGARLHGANLSKADLRNVNFKSTDLTGANLFESNIVNAKFDENTILPDGTQWNFEVDMSKYINTDSWTKKNNWLEQIDVVKESLDLEQLLKQKTTVRNVILYLNHQFPNSEIEIAEDELHFLRHWKALIESGYETISDVHDLLYRTEKARQWVWENRKPPYLIIYISYSIALENPKHMNLTHWTKDTIEKVNLARKEFFNI
ncbi:MULTISPECIES: pentapeptide repeat-containing protein [Flavobacteriaceae]|uniref:pentapeptide repeat-containing protein n=1 Tax=Flavobacteriaceae TaxID=49546 RepID=UPI001492503E|nr:MULTISPECIES: pentapeptide repeat-containing protein [Allomuricauda]MDC6367239.1 pentapeptide repeat-containing protein [Muricauda sp. AC10]